MLNFISNQKPELNSESISVFFYSKNQIDDIIKKLESYSFTPDNAVMKTLLADNEEGLLLPIKNENEHKTVYFNFIDLSKPNALRNSGSTLVKYLSKKNYKDVNIDLQPAVSNPSIQHFRELLEGFYLGGYKFDKYKSDKKEVKNKNITFITGFELTPLFKEIDLLFKGVDFSRDMSNEPANFLTPAKFAELIKKEIASDKVEVTVIERPELEEKKFGLILNVGGASDNPPCLIKLHYKPKTAKKKIALVGKGVTYDAGGLSIKTTAGMFEMKADMAGAGSVAGAVHAAALNDLPYEIIALIPAVENMISGNSYKPGDILTAYNGKTVEIGDTDAEGRLILADALAYADEFKPDYIVDLATLTGAAYIALGSLYSAGFSTDDKLVNVFETAGKVSYELVWRMPLVEEYKPFLETEIADIKNLGPRQAGAITAAEFLHFFVNKETPWLHLDIAGPSIKSDTLDYYKNYNTGYGVRLIYQVLKSESL